MNHVQALGRAAAVCEIIVGISLAVACLAIVLFVLAACAQPPARSRPAAAQSRPAVAQFLNAQEWCETFEYERGTPVFDECVSRYSRVRP